MGEPSMDLRKRLLAAIDDGHADGAGRPINGDWFEAHVNQVLDLPDPRIAEKF